MSLWRFGRSWPETEMKRCLANLSREPVNFDVPLTEMTEENGWIIDGVEDRLGTERRGPPEPDGLFERAKCGVLNYDFSDPSIVEGHYDPQHPLAGRDMLLEIKVLGLHFLNGARVQSVQDIHGEAETIFGFRYDTLGGHIECGYEWFLLRKDHRTGDVSFRIEAHWRTGDFPNWWTRLGFAWLSPRYRSFWRFRAMARLRCLAYQEPEKAVALPGKLAHRGDPEPVLSRPLAPAHA